MVLGYGGNFRVIVILSFGFMYHNTMTQRKKYTIFDNFKHGLDHHLPSLLSDKIRLGMLLLGKWDNSLYNDVKIELCKHLEQLEQTLANVEGTVEGVNNCIESFTQILNNVFFAFLW